MTREEANFWTTPVKFTLAAISGALAATALFSWNTAAAWSSTTQKVEDHSSRIAKLEIREENRDKDYIALRESIITLQVQMKSLSDNVVAVGRDVKDIRTVVR